MDKPTIKKAVKDVWGNKNPEESLDELMEHCLELKAHNTMEKQLEAIKSTYSNYNHYKEKLKQAQQNNHYSL